MVEDSKEMFLAESRAQAKASLVLVLTHTRIPVLVYR